MPSEITRSIMIDAPAALIFEALTTEAELAQWMPRSAKIDARVGGEYEFNFYWAAKKVETTARGRVVELVPNRKVSYTFASSEDPPGTPPSLVTWTIEECSDGKSRVTLVHSGIDAASCLKRSQGWGYYLDRLAAYSSRSPVRQLTR